jgi:hypothetical protein
MLKNVIVTYYRSIMFGLRSKLILAVVGWTVTRVLRRLSLPGLAMVVALEVIMSLVQSRLSGKRKG